MLPHALLLLIVLVMPLISSAATSVAAPKDFKGFLDILNGLISILIPFIFALTFITIMWGTIKAWVMGEGSGEDIKNGKTIVFVGVIALVIMSSIWGILQLLKVSLFGQ